MIVSLEPVIRLKMRMQNPTAASRMGLHVALHHAHVLVGRGDGRLFDDAAAAAVYVHDGSRGVGQRLASGCSVRGNVLIGPRRHRQG